MRDYDNYIVSTNKIRGYGRAKKDVMEIGLEEALLDNASLMRSFTAAALEGRGGAGVHSSGHLTGLQPGPLARFRDQSTNKCKKTNNYLFAYKE